MNAPSPTRVLALGSTVCLFLLAGLVLSLYLAYQARVATNVSEANTVLASGQARVLGVELEVLQKRAAFLAKKRSVVMALSSRDEEQQAEVQKELLASDDKLFYVYLIPLYDLKRFNLTSEENSLIKANEREDKQPPLMVGHSEGFYYFVVAAPVKNAEGKMLGSLVMAYKMSFIINLLSSFDPTKGSIALAQQVFGEPVHVLFKIGDTPPVPDEKNLFVIDGTDWNLLFTSASDRFSQNLNAVLIWSTAGGLVLLLLVTVFLIVKNYKKSVIALTLYTAEQKQLTDAENKKQMMPGAKKLTRAKESAEERKAKIEAVAEGNLGFGQDQGAHIDGAEEDTPSVEEPAKKVQPVEPEDEPDALIVEDSPAQTSENNEELVSLDDLGFGDDDEPMGEAVIDMDILDDVDLDDMGGMLDDIVEGEDVEVVDNLFSEEAEGAEDTDSTVVRPAVNASFQGDFSDGETPAGDDDEEILDIDALLKDD